MTRPQQDLGVANLSLGESTRLLAWIPQRALCWLLCARGVDLRHESLGFRCVSAEVLIGKKENLHALALLQRLVAASHRPIEDVRRVRTRAARATALTDECFHRGA